MKWQILGKLKVKDIRSQDIIRVLLQNRKIKTRKQEIDFLNPKLESVTPQSVGIDKAHLDRSVARIKEAIKNKEQIVVFGDYDVDGVCATAIVWESLRDLGGNVTPYIPHRIDEGYGLSETGIKNLKLKIKNCSLIITVDNGIIASDAVDFANKSGIDVIVTDHHTKLKTLPKAYSIVHTTKLCGAGVAYLLTQEIKSQISKIKNRDKIDEHLELAGIATIADLMPLVEENRTIVKFALESLRKTERVGLLEIFNEAQIEKKNLGVYEISYIVAPRLNAAGRIEKAIDSLRLLCTKDKRGAKLLAEKLGMTNRKRQKITEETLIHAKSTLQLRLGQEKKKLIFIDDKSYEQGVIGLVAGKLAEQYYLPAIVLSKGEKYTKASARSISGFNIINFIREAKEFLVDAGGHPMAAGFTVETSKLKLLEKKLQKLATKMLTKKLLTKEIKVDLEIPLSLVNFELMEELERLEPFGMGNPTPTFLSLGLLIHDMQLVGQDGKHVRFFFRDEKSNRGISAIGFGLSGKTKEIAIGDRVDIVYTALGDEWNGNKRIQLKLKDFKKTI
jgi:single-stranded-DNA-specific exonuclease